MAHYMTCPECGNYIAKYSNFIEVAKQALYNEATTNSKYAEYDPKKIVFNPSITPGLEVIFDALPELKLRCCRMHITTCMPFDKQPY